MVRKALCFIVQRGPSTEQDRWEEVSGYSPYTIAVEIAALLEAAEFTVDPEITSTCAKRRMHGMRASSDGHMPVEPNWRRNAAWTVTM